MSGRPLTGAERNLAASVFGNAINYDAVTIQHRKWWWFQPRRVTMAPDGHIWFHPKSGLYCDDFCGQNLAAQGLFIHEMTHVWQRQKGIFLPLARHPFCRYDYALKPGWPLERYGIEQQAEIVKHAFMLRQGATIRGAPSLGQYESVLPFLRG
ncbi:vgr related protein [Sphingomonas sp. LaA6.9]|uniref:vgr related protein n=1 Tax=Sphingomonas sp. LaA6.9 TaxID=2919914 RepID=UPI001F4F3D17|nr:vgr related protein [Sphingomonas sp. LaA6.9]MCJ8159408.1 vgr related protein [Sphingomonas sp. LaA6.9]